MYNPLYGLEFFPAATTEFRKALTLAPLRRPVEALGASVLARPGVRARLARRPLTVNVHVAGLGEAHLALGPDAFRLVDGYAAAADLAVRVPPTVLASVRSGSRALASTLAREAARGQVRVRGLARGGPRLLSLALAALRRG